MHRSSAARICPANLTWKGYDRLLTVSLAAAGVCAWDTSVMQDRIGQLCGQFKPHHGRPVVAVSPPLDTAMPWHFPGGLEQEAEDAETGASTGCAGSPGCPRARLPRLRATTESPWLCGSNWIQLAQGSFVERGKNVLAFGLPGTGKTH